MKLSDWHRCRRYWRKGYNCPMTEEEEHDDDDEEQKRKALRKAGERGSEQDLEEIRPVIKRGIRETGTEAPWYEWGPIIHRGKKIKELVKKKAEPPEVPSEFPPFIEPEELPRAAFGVPPAGALPPAGKVAGNWLRNYVRTIPNVGTVRSKVRTGATEGGAVKTREREPGQVSVGSLSPRGVMGRAEQTFAQSLPTSRLRRETSGSRPRSVGRNWRREAAFAASVGIGITAAVIVRKSGGPPAGGGKHMPAPKYRGGGKMPAFGFAP